MGWFKGLRGDSRDRRNCIVFSVETLPALHGVDGVYKVPIRIGTIPALVTYFVNLALIEIIAPKRLFQGLSSQKTVYFKKFECPLSIIAGAPAYKYDSLFGKCCN